MPEEQQNVVDSLRALQQTHGYLPPDELRRVSEHLGVPLYRLHGVASFFPHFRLTPPPVVEVLICDDMTCHLRDGATVLSALEAAVGEAGLAGMTVRRVSCLGRCDRAPAAVVNDTIRTAVSARSLLADVHAILDSGTLADDELVEAARPLAVDPYDDGDHYRATRRIAATHDIESALKAVKASELRGMGGAGFPTAMKWELVRDAPGDVKYIICNADESEPGTIKDRFLLSQVPYLVIEGMIVAGLVTGARQGYVYIRHEYEREREAVERELAACRERGLLGTDILGTGSSFDVSVFVSPGGYICGEETALLEAMEGRRAEPRNKPPFPVTDGLWKRPTVINNVETFAFVPLILEKSANWFKACGRGDAPGLKFVAISGDVVLPGVYEIAMGTPAREVIFDLAGGVSGGRKLKAWAPSGPSSGYLPASLVDVTLDFKALSQVGSMLGSGAIVVCAEGTCMLDMALNATRFYKTESCGKCVPCRVGSAKLVDLLTAFSEGRGRSDDLAVIDDLSHALALTSICGLGQVVPRPIQSVLTHFRDEVEAHIVDRRCPSGVCPVGS